MLGRASRVFGLVVDMKNGRPSEHPEDDDLIALWRVQPLHGSGFGNQTRLLDSSSWGSCFHRTWISKQIANSQRPHTAPQVAELDMPVLKIKRKRTWCASLQVWGGPAQRAGFKSLDDICGLQLCILSLPLVRPTPSRRSSGLVGRYSRSDASCRERVLRSLQDAKSGAEETGRKVRSSDLDLPRSAEV